MGASSPLPQGNPILGRAVRRTQAGRAELSLSLRRAKGAAKIWPRLGKRGQKLLDKDDTYTHPQIHLNVSAHASALKSAHRPFFFLKKNRLKRENKEKVHSW